MAGEAQGNIWPLPKFHFTVQLGDGQNVTFQEVTGLENGPQTIEYRHGSSPIASPIKMPGLAHVGNVTLKKGIFVKNSSVFAWYADIAKNLIQRRTVIISLLDENGQPTMTWTLTNAWPTKCTGTDLKSDGNEVAVETLELAYETMAVMD